jgi:signal transduction histidine kinase
MASGHRPSMLKERYRLLDCRYRIAQLCLDPELSFEERLRRILAIVPQAFRFPPALAVRIELDGVVYHGDVVVTGSRQLAKVITIRGKRRGRVTVVYDDALPLDTEPPVFLPQEKRFLEAVARKLAWIAASKEARAAEEALKEQIRHADRLATIGQLAAGIAHELNNPLADILGFAQLATNTPDLPEQTYEDLVKIVKSALYAREVIKKILFFSRQPQLKQTTTNLNDLVKDWLGFIQPRCAQNDIRLSLELHRALPVICGDPSQLNQVLVNLVVNAIHAMPDGGRLTIRTHADDQSVYLAVLDTGTGIDAQIRDKIFLPFFTTKEVDKGTGLGLSVVYGIVKEHGGQISVESQVGRGSQFTIRFPCGAGPCDASPIGAPAGTPNG